MTKEPNFSQIALNIEKSLDAGGISEKANAISNADDFRQLVAELVGRMMEGDFERFLALMYRLDVSERKLKAAMNTGNPQNVYLEIAGLIIEREKKKIFWREKYRS